ncbi:Uncharacterised protein [Mycobacteroides abscessus subsp. abscessus]|nr:Uncharacterised protein [Mycobacteroides abscessus subsp. abscessus]
MLSIDSPSGKRKYATMNQIVPIIEAMNHSATWRSATFWARGSASVSRGLCSGRPGLVNPFSSSSWLPPPECSFEVMNFPV